MKILCIGNSFSQDSSRYLEAISQNELTIRNCYIGGCSLEEHCRQLDSGAASYEYQKDGEPIGMISLREALSAEQWDVVTLQQASWLSGLPESYEPWLGRLVETVGSACPQAEILFHRTWAYDTVNGHPHFGLYDNNQETMYYAICEATEAAAQAYGLRIIPVGDAIQRARLLPEFHTETGGLSLTRDGYHLSLDYGRYLAGLVWYHALTGRRPEEVSFAPEGTDPLRIALLKQTVCPECGLE